MQYYLALIEQHNYHTNFNKMIPKFTHAPKVKERENNHIREVYRLVGEASVRTTQT